jgi:protein phosphatase
MGDTAKNWADCLRSAAISDVGMRRTSNQDAYKVSLAGDEDSWRRRGHLFVVADGMGAHAAGELASKIAADTIPFLYRKYREEDAPEALRRSVIETNAEVHRRGQANADFHNMGTTCSALALLPGVAVAAHVGDSRIYRLRRGVLEQLTFDHSLVWEMRAAGHLAEGSEAASRLPKNVITRSLGPNASVEVDLEGPFPIEAGDTFLLCSDGLTGQVADEELAPILASLPPEDAARFLVDLANLRGGPDNVTVLIAQITSDAAPHNGASLSPRSGARARRPVHPAIWAISGALILVALVLPILGNGGLTPVAIVVGLVGLLGMGIGLWRSFGPETALPPRSGEGRMGHGPYTQTPSNKAEQLAARLRETMEELRQAAIEEDWTIDWPPINRRCESAEKARQARDHQRALQEYSQAISFMMKELRQQRRKKKSDSAVDLF